MSVLLLSGGLDSAVLLAQEVSEGRYPLCVGFDYGQRHDRELDSAAQLAIHYECEFQRLTFLGILRGSALTSDCLIPHAHYADPVQKATIVPNRNMVLLSLAAAIAVDRGLDTVFFAAHSGDALVYPDCRPAFVEAIHYTMQFACGVKVRAPFLRMTKRDVVALGRSLGVPFEMTWSCYEGGGEPCGLCGACCERNEALT